jgi:DNA/RNA-binding domain of Phe-tRNA-synthetase-like protein
LPISRGEHGFFKEILSLPAEKNAEIQLKKAILQKISTFLKKWRFFYQHFGIDKRLSYK